MEAMKSTPAVRELMESIMKVRQVQNDIAEMASMTAQEAVEKKVMTGEKML
jgi:hypothetical protein